MIFNVKSPISMTWSSHTPYLLSLHIISLPYIYIHCVSKRLPFNVFRNDMCFQPFLWWLDAGDWTPFRIRTDGSQTACSSGQYGLETCFAKKIANILTICNRRKGRIHKHALNVCYCSVNNKILIKLKNDGYTVLQQTKRQNLYTSSQCMYYDTVI